MGRPAYAPDGGVQTRAIATRSQYAEGFGNAGACDHSFFPLLPLRYSKETEKPRERKEQIDTVSKDKF
jgi:hypothetical protein